MGWTGWARGSGHLRRSDARIADIVMQCFLRRHASAEELHGIGKEGLIKRQAADCSVPC